MSFIQNIKSMAAGFNQTSFIEWLEQNTLRNTLARGFAFGAIGGLVCARGYGSLDASSTYQLASLFALIYAGAAKVAPRTFFRELGIMCALIIGQSFLLGDRLSVFSALFLMSADIALLWYVGKARLWLSMFELQNKLENKDKAFAALRRDAEIFAEHTHHGLYLIRLNTRSELSAEGLYSNLLPTHENADALSSIWRSSDLKSTVLAEIHAMLKNALGSTILHWDYHSLGLPKTFHMVRERDLIVVNAAWKALHGDDGIVHTVLLHLDDVTALKCLEEDAKARNEDAKRLLELTSNSPKKIWEFFAMMEALITEGRQWSTDKPQNSVVNAQNIHTLKGMAGGYQLEELHQCLVDLETRFVGSKNVLYLRNEPSFHACDVALRNYRNLLQKVYTRRTSPNRVSVDPQVVLGLTKDIETAYMRSDMGSALNALNEIRALFATTLDKIVVDEISMLRKLADELGKLQPSLYINEVDIQIDEESRIALRKVFVHLFRNSIDHGIETKEERETRGKSPRGQISIRTDRNGEHYRIIYKDDGKGLALSKILKRAIELGSAEADRTYTDQDIADLIFQPGLSTAESGSSISGRGVGMDAIRSFLVQEGGNISIHLDESRESPYSPFSFYIDVPVCSEKPKTERLKKFG
ncbi:MAG: hypothetical protein H7249_01275 [Chitinophagaceae bacterium]|nr:hypothetical protein [Oligoflexus sp.]